MLIIIFLFISLSLFRSRSLTHSVTHTHTHTHIHTEHEKRKSWSELLTFCLVFGNKLAVLTEDLLYISDFTKSITTGWKPHCHRVETSLPLGGNPTATRRKLNFS